MAKKFSELREKMSPESRERSGGEHGRMLGILNGDAVTVTLRYPVNLLRENGNVLVSFPDFPGVLTYGDDEEEALERAADALETYLGAMFEDRKPLPNPSCLGCEPRPAIDATAE